MWIARDIAVQLHELAATRPAVMVTGARQTGKTSLLRHEFPGHAFVSLDVPSEAELAETDPAAFLRLHPPPIIVDEAQYAPKLFRHLKLRIDHERQATGRFLLTGSQKHQLMKGSAESLAGRIALLELETLSRKETLSVAPQVDVDSTLLRGGYPELHASPRLDAGAFFRAYTATYLERDVRTLLSVSSLRDFERFIRCCALRCGQLLNKAELARDVGVSAPTINQWLSVLQASNIVILLEPWFTNKTKSLVKSPKLYFADTGLLCHLLGIRTTEELLSSPLWGSIWETFVFSELRKRQVASRGEWSCYFWADRRHEVDFLLHSGGRFDLYDAKVTPQPGQGDAGQLRYVEAQLTPGRVKTRGLICRVPHSYPLGGGFEAIAVDALSF